jgi:cobalt-zinc-cadmium efflux system protein
VILWGTWGLLRESIRLTLNAAPRDIDPHDVRQYLAGLPQVDNVHDLHIWAMSTKETALSCHLVTPRGHPGDDFLKDVAHELDHRFEICHATIQIELEVARSACRAGCGRRRGPRRRGSVRAYRAWRRPSRRPAARAR